MRDNCWSVYWLLLPDGKWYFGISKNVSRRIKQHKNDCRDGNHPFVTYEVIHSDLTESEARQYETELMKTFPSVNKLISWSGKDSKDTLVRKAFGYTHREWLSLSKEARAYCRRDYEVRNP